MWQPIETAPKDQFLLLCGLSGYTTTPMVVTTGRMCSDYHIGRWIDHANDDLIDWGFEPTHWMPLILPGAQPVESIKDVIIAGLQSQFDTEGITEHDSGDALIRLSDAIAAVEDNFAQPAPIAQDESVRKAWARFCNELYRSPDAPYPGMADAFERHFSQSFTDREWRTESATWAAAWKAAKRHEAQARPAPSIPEGWLRAIDEALVVAHIGVANESDTYEQAKAKFNNLIGFHVDVATDPAVNGGWKLVPIEPTPGMIDAAEYVDWGDADVRGSCINAWDRMLAAAPEAKP